MLLWAREGREGAQRAAWLQSCSVLVAQDGLAHGISQIDMEERRWFQQTLTLIYRCFLPERVHCFLAFVEIFTWCMADFEM